MKKLKEIGNRILQKIFRVAIYIRLSKEDGDKEESSSVSNQREIIHKYINENENFVFVEEYIDDRIHRN